MARKKKSTKKNAKKAAAPRNKPVKKKAARKPTKKKALRSKPSVKKKAPRKKAMARKKATTGKKSRAIAKPARNREQDDSAYPLAPPLTEVEAGDLQGLSNRRGADSESVDELLEEGNAFEAGVVSGVEDADNNDGREVHTREFPEDDVPEEYLDED